MGDETSYDQIGDEAFFCSVEDTAVSIARYTIVHSIGAVPFIGETAALLAQSVMDSAGQAQRNKGICDEISIRVQRSLELIAAYKPQGNLRGAQEAYERALSEAESYVKKINTVEDDSKKNIIEYFIKLLSANWVFEMHQKIIQDLDDATNDFHRRVSLDTHGITSNINDKVNEIQSRFDELIKITIEKNEMMEMERKKKEMEERKKEMEEMEKKKKETEEKKKETEEKKKKETEEKKKKETEEKKKKTEEKKKKETEEKKKKEMEEKKKKETEEKKKETEEKKKKETREKKKETEEISNIKKPNNSNKNKTPDNGSNLFISILAFPFFNKEGRRTNRTTIPKSKESNNKDKISRGQIRVRKFIGEKPVVKNRCTISLKEVNIVRLLGYYKSIEKFFRAYYDYVDGDRCLFANTECTEWMQYESLQNYLTKHEIKSISRTTELQIAGQISKGLSFCNKGIVHHRDVRRRISPEKLKRPNEVYALKCELYSIAIVLWEISAHKFPFSNINGDMEVMEKVKAGKCSTAFSNVTLERRKRIIEQTWHQERDKRPEMNLDKMIKVRVLN